METKSSAGAIGVIVVLCVVALAWMYAQEPDPSEVVVRTLTSLSRGKCASERRTDLMDESEMHMIESWEGECPEQTLKEWLRLVDEAVRMRGIGNQIWFFPTSRDLDDFRLLRRVAVRYSSYWRTSDFTEKEQRWHRLTDDERAYIADYVSSMR